MHQRCRVRCRAIIIHEGKLLVVKNSRGSEYYALPGGHLDPGETPEECMVREIVEEIGITPVIKSLLYVYTFTDRGGETSVEFFFEAQNGSDFISHEKQVGTHAHELSEVRWIKKTDEVLLLPEEIHAHFKNGNFPDLELKFLKGESRQ